MNGEHGKMFDKIEKNHKTKDIRLSGFLAQYRSASIHTNIR